MNLFRGGDKPIVYDVAVIVPLYNEAQAIPTLLSELEDYLSDYQDKKIQVVFVDDGSTDESSEILSKHSFQHFQPKLVRLSKNCGSHAALRAGIQHARAQYTTFLYADLQDPVHLIFDLYKKSAGAADIVWAFRKGNKSPFLEKCFSKLYAVLMRTFVTKRFPENGFDIVMFSEKVQRELNQNAEAHSSVFLQILQLGFRQESIEYDRRPRAEGKSKWTLAKKVKLLIDSFLSFSYAPIRFVSVMGVCMFLTGFAWSSYIVWRALAIGDLNQGWPTLIAVLMLGFGITNVSLGILAE
ncbi:glycosyltransferase, partial [Omnitrophica bacterium]|nr:glycosyltransferase [Candidatus Omnitrophota bacterium]